MEKDKEINEKHNQNSSPDIVQFNEAIKGAIWGILMMIVVFLFVHYALGITAFS